MKISNAEEGDARYTQGTAPVDRVLAEQALYGDHFSPTEIEQWFVGENEGYYDFYYRVARTEQPANMAGSPPRCHSRGQIASDRGGLCFGQSAGLSRL